MGIIDVHAHLGRFPFPIPDGTVQLLKELCEQHDIERVMVSSVEAIMCDMVSGNAKLAEAIANDESFLGYVTINPNYLDESMSEMRKYLYLKNFVGAKLHPSYSGQPLSSERTYELVKAYRRYDKPLLVHTYSASDAFTLTQLTKQFPELIVIMAHMGGPQWEDAIRVVEKHPRIFVEPCSSIPDRDKLRFAIDRLGPRRVLFGSDMPLLHPSVTLGMIIDADLTDSQRDAVLYRNAKYLFGI
ncbi:MAG: amidohydrolase family protein [Armatimonadota bacterium]|nr:amidohydrolase family protein [Armatimonadota bacterium]MCX7778480.1 amidohydrolase family protein [Armatimonadota bacterium]MDW8026236.1 amidohydrolase family protein [Armatimonadota bacterium]